ncbi:TetR/AcrR family transcriptional regulator [Sandarakinorhabdus rubra]|uniref:TetR/AcrR family transcriptional regulator n=1 Tax=Sandarakinorhabdus rubra TaxID=2672568 RepID=UPI0013DBA148|nr:TetR/AcrR family transcriptional regulator [Sandarakinorhabdus rubra]
MPKQPPKLPSITVADLAVPPREGGYVRGDKTREDILRAALGLLVEDGYRALSMRRVAAACGMRLGNLTYHFPTREDLLRALFEAVIGSYEVEFAEIARLPGPAPEVQLVAVCQLILDDIRTKKTTHLFPELWALSNHDAFVLERVQELYARARQPILEAIAAMRPDLDEATRQDLALFISASMEGLTIFAGHGKPFEARMPDLEQIAIGCFLDLVRTYGRPE